MKTIKNYKDFLNENRISDETKDSIEILFDLLRPHGDVNNIGYYSGGFVDFDFNGEEYTIFDNGDDEVEFLGKTYSIDDMESILNVIIGEEETENNEKKDINLSLELEYLMRTKSDEEMGDLDVDGFFEMFGVTTGKSNYAWASVLNGRQKYEDMSDEEFFEIYKNYKN